MYAEPRFLACGDSALVVEFGDEIDEAVNARVLQLDRNLARQNIAGVRELVPTYRSLLVHYDPIATSFSHLREAIKFQFDSVSSHFETNRTWSIPVVYGSEFGIDLDELATNHLLSPAEVIARHTAGEYRVCMIGFMPGFAYLGGLDARLATPRRRQPRQDAPAGTISIGGIQTAVQSVVGPSGWHWIGRTPLKVYDPQRTPMCLFDPGDIVRFQPVAARDWGAASEQCRAMIDEARQ